MNEVGFSGVVGPVFSGASIDYTFQYTGRVGGVGGDVLIKTCGFLVGFEGEKTSFWVD